MHLYFSFLLLFFGSAQDSDVELRKSFYEAYESEENNDNNQNKGSNSELTILGLGFQGSNSELEQGKTYGVGGRVVGPQPISEVNILLKKL